MDKIKDWIYEGEIELYVERHKGKLLESHQKMKFGRDIY